MLLFHPVTARYIIIGENWQLSLGCSSSRLERGLRSFHCGSALRYKATCPLHPKWLYILYAAEIHCMRGCRLAAAESLAVGSKVQPYVCSPLCISACSNRIMCAVQVTFDIKRGISNIISPSFGQSSAWKDEYTWPGCV
jgi:hypothetical protein